MWQFTTADRFKYDIGSKINVTSSAPSRSAIIYGFNHDFFVFISCWLQDQINWYASIPKGKFWTCTGVKRISQASCFTSTGGNMKWDGILLSSQCRSLAYAYMWVYDLDHRAWEVSTSHKSLTKFNGMASNQNVYGVIMIAHFWLW